MKPYRTPPAAEHRTYTVAYEPPAYDEDPQPRVIFWFRAYAASMLLVSLALLGFATLGAYALTDADVAMRLNAAEAQLQIILFFLVAAALVVLYGVATFMPRKPWAWTLGLIVIALGCPSVTVVVCLPLLFAWLKPNVKAAFCRL